MKEIRSEIIIKAPLKKVWDILIDLESYKTWNSFTPKIETNFKVGSEVILQVNMNPGKKLLTQKEEILWYKEMESFAWGINKTFPVKTERAQILKALDEQRTQYITYDKFWGILTPLVMLLYKNKIQKGFDAVAQDLKNKAEK